MSFSPKTLLTPQKLDKSLNGWNRPEPLRQDFQSIGNPSWIVDPFV
jgi:hypothetical protein